MNSYGIDSGPEESHDEVDGKFSRDSIVLKQNLEHTPLLRLERNCERTPVVSGQQYVTSTATQPLGNAVDMHSHNSAKEYNCLSCDCLVVGFVVVVSFVGHLCLPSHFIGSAFEAAVHGRAEVAIKGDRQHALAVAIERL